MPAFKTRLFRCFQAEVLRQFHAQFLGWGLMGVGFLIVPRVNCDFELGALVITTRAASDTCRGTLRIIHHIGMLMLTPVNFC